MSPDLDWREGLFVRMNWRKVQGYVFANLFLAECVHEYAMKEPIDLSFATMPFTDGKVFGTGKVHR